MPTPLAQAWREMRTLPQAFGSATQERNFLAEHSRRFASHRRLSLILGFLMDAIYLVWDYLYSAGDPAFTPALNAVVINRSLTTLALLPPIFLTLRPRFERDEAFATQVLVGTVTVQFAFYCCGFLLAPFPYDYMYFFMGMFICLIFGFSMLRLRARPNTVLMVACIVLAVLTFIWNGQIKHDALSNPVARIYVWVATSLLVSAGVMGMLVGILLEGGERASFLRTDELAQSNLALRQHSEQVVQLNAALIRSSQESEARAQALIALKDRMREEAERRNKEKSQFLATAVHDLKQPIQAIGNALEPGRQALESHDFDKALGMFDLAAAATQLMREQLAGILEISRLESGYVQAEISSFDLLPIIDNVLSQVADLARRDGVSLNLPGGAAEPLIVKSDRHFIGRILLNLIANGIKYHDTSKSEQPWVRVAIHPLETCVNIEITDNGQGIAEEHIRSGAIFKPFFQANNRRRESEKGVGLGLSIVHAMLELMPGHRLHIDSILGEGTRIVLKLPWGKTAQQTPAEILELLAETEQGSFDASGLRGLYVLYVEDDELVRASTLALFEVYGILCEAADSLEQLGELLQRMERLPDLLLTDYRLPNGATALDVVRAVEDTCGPLPVLVVTGEVMEHHRDTPTSWHLLRKPVSSRELLQAFCDITSQFKAPDAPPAG